MKRIIPEVNAGSMADIGFLLLVFFLLVTRIEEEKGIFTIMPPFEQDPPEGEVNRRNVLELWLHHDGTLKVNESEASLRDLSQSVRGFYLNSGLIAEMEPSPNLPLRKPADVRAIRTELDSLLRSGDSTSQTYRRLSNKSCAIDHFGNPRLLPPSAGILYHISKSADYNRYIEVMDEVHFALGQLRDSVSVAHFGTPFDDLKGERIGQKQAVIALLPEKLVEDYKD